MIDWFQRRFGRREKTRTEMIQDLRGHLLFFGVDTSSMTDEEIEAAVMRMHKAVRSFGVTTDQVKECTERLSQLHRASR